MNNENEKRIFTTKDYDEFKILKGNRAITDVRLRKIINSIQEVGYITNPIIVNENMEVIDGQGRLRALKELNMSVDYIVVEGAGINQCLYMNINQTNWTLKDYINSYAANGIDGYIKLKQLSEKYPEFNLYVCLTATRGVAKVDSSIMKSGNLIITDEEYEKGIEALEYLKQFVGLFNNIEGRIQYLYQAILYCYTFDCVNNDRLLAKMTELSQTIPPFSNLMNAIEITEQIYNKNIQKDYAFIITEYRRSLMTRMRAGSRAVAEAFRIAREKVSE